MIFETTIDALRRVNRGIALAAGLLLILTVTFILVDIVLRQFGRSLGGSDEISGYVMAIVGSWGLSYALLELAHVRIDLLRLRLAPAGRWALDIVSILALSATTIVIAFQCWPVLAKTIARDSRANTPLETPLWIPQAIWFGGWAWFALTSTALLLCAIALLARRRTDVFEEAFGTVSEAEALQ